MGGEKLNTKAGKTAFRGSPPRGRGKAAVQGWMRATEGITPAWAGKRPQTAHRVKPQQDHPRVGGEKHHRPQAVAPFPGSPPRGRGKECRQYMAHLLPGITPAWAGKRYRFCYMRIFKKDHPRVGGEKFQKHIDMLQDTGSPPRGRGKVALGMFYSVSMGITPAWAGKSPPF